MLHGLSSSNAGQFMSPFFKIIDFLMAFGIKKWIHLYLERNLMLC